MNAYGLGTIITTNTENQDVMFPELTMKGHFGISYGLLSNMYFNKQQDFGFAFAINGKRGDYVAGLNSSYYTPET